MKQIAFALVAVLGLAGCASPSAAEVKREMAKQDFSACLVWVDFVNFYIDNYPTPAEIDKKVAQLNSRLEGNESLLAFQALDVMKRDTDLQKRLDAEDPTADFDAIDAMDADRWKITSKCQDLGVTAHFKSITP